MPKLTRIEVLDQQYPGLADEVRKWFTQGISARNVAGLLLERYEISLPPTTIGSFRSQRWVPERELLRQKKIEVLAAAEIAREKEVKAALACNVPGEEQ